jgi:hypothetical protein
LRFATAGSPSLASVRPNAALEGRQRLGEHRRDRDRDRAYHRTKGRDGDGERLSRDHVQSLVVGAPALRGPRRPS